MYSQRYYNRAIGITMYSQRYYNVQPEELQCTVRGITLYVQPWESHYIATCNTLTARSITLYSIR
jgi:hypothetical protein